ncbi:MAG: glycine zipper 2TM domain-containing protein [Methylobacter sp.]
MNKWLFLIPALLAASVYSSLSYADRDGWRGRGHHHGHGHRHGHHHGHHPARYYSRPQVNHYYAPPPAPSYAQPPYDRRSHQGLAGGVVGSVLGYEIGNGDPIAAGLGAAAGSFLGNGMGRRY